MSSGDLGGVGEVEFWRAEAKRLAAENVVLQTRVADLEGQVGALAEKVSVLARRRSGRRRRRPSGRRAATARPVGLPAVMTRPMRTRPAGRRNAVAGSGRARADT